MPNTRHDGGPPRIDRPGRQATDNLTVAARKLSDDPVITNNAMVLRNKLDALYDDGRGEGED